MTDPVAETLYETISLQATQEGLAVVTLNRPDVHNAFNALVIEELTDAFDTIADQETIRMMILRGNGPSFSAGADLNWMKRMASYSYEENLADANALAQMLKNLNFMQQPTIAKVQGAAFGGAVGLASCCDIVMASEKASFCLSEVKLGLIPATISPYVVNAIGQKASRRYFQTAERFFADKAQQLGLVDEILPLTDLDSAVENMTQTLLANGPLAVRQAKQLALDVAYQDIDEALIEMTSARIAAIRVSQEGQEGLTAFFEKRQPTWQESTNKGEG